MEAAVTYGSPEPGYGGNQGYGPPPRRTRPRVAWSIGGALALVALVLFGLYACRPSSGTPATYTTTTTGPTSSVVDTPPPVTSSPVVVPPGNPYPSSDDRPPRTTPVEPPGTTAPPAPPTRVEAGSGGRAGLLDPGQDTALVLGGSLLAAVAVAVLAGRRRRTR
jgi:hypothetical protein